MDITIKNAKVHNLRGIDVTIPRDSLTVVTGLSGSGKSSLAFDTLYAEGQRRYVESLSAYARQFLDRMQKPDVEKIEGLSPAISIEQRTTSGNPRSIVATVTEIHDYLRVLYGSIAVAHCPHCGKPVVKQSAEQIVEAILGEWGTYPPSEASAEGISPERSENCEAISLEVCSMRGGNGERAGGAKIIIYAPLVKGKKGRHEEPLAAVKRNGFARVKIDGTIYPVDELPALDKKKAHTIDVVVDRLVIPSAPDAAFKTRLTDSVELALKTGKGIMVVERLPSAAQSNNQTIKQSNNQFTYSELNACPDCGISFDELKARSFSFNSPFGACPTCAGLGQLYYFDEDLVVPDKSLPLEEAIHPWRRMGQMNILYHKELLAHIAKQYKVKLSTPYEKLPAKFRHGLMHGFKDDLVLPWRRVDRPFEGVLASLQRRLDEAEDDEMRAKFEAYQSFRTCPDCNGSRLRPESRAATVAGKSIVEVMAMPVTEALEFFKEIQRGTWNGKSNNSNNQTIKQSAKLEGLKDIIAEIVRRLQFLLDVGLDYLTLDRAASTLSGGEMQRIRLATQIGSGLTGVLYVLDEPTIGLHPRDNERLISTLKGLRDRGNTVVVVEHDEEMMRNADYIVDLGPGAGREGGKVMYQGNFKGLLKSKSLTADYLTGRKRVVTADDRQPTVASRKSNGLSGAGCRLSKNSAYLTISGCTEHNLKNITARFPVGALSRRSLTKR